MVGAMHRSRCGQVPWSGQALVFCLLGTVRALPSWGTIWAHRAASWQAGNGPGDTLDRAAVDRELLRHYSKGGNANMFYHRYFRPEGGFQTPVGEQAACILDKAVFVLDLHFCLAPRRERVRGSQALHASRWTTSNRAVGKATGCNVGVVQQLALSLDRCCDGSEHVPLWRSMHTCKRSVHPLSAALRTRAQPLLLRCLRAAQGARQGAGPGSGEESGGSALARGGRVAQLIHARPCLKLLESTLLVVRRLMRLSARLYVESHRLDLSSRTRAFLQACATIDVKRAMLAADPPGMGEPAAGARAGFGYGLSTSCRHLVVRMHQHGIASGGAAFGATPGAASVQSKGDDDWLADDDWVTAETPEADLTGTSMPTTTAPKTQTDAPASTTIPPKLSARLRAELAREQALHARMREVELVNMCAADLPPCAHGCEDKGGKCVPATAA